MRCRLREASFTRCSRMRKMALIWHISAHGRKEERNSPQLSSRWPHWQSSLSVLGRPLTYFKSPALTTPTSRPASSRI